MRKLSWLGAVVAAAVAALVGTAAVQAVAAPAAGNDPASVLKFATMAPVTGPYVGAECLNTHSRREILAVRLKRDAISGFKEATMRGIFAGAAITAVAAVAVAAPVAVAAASAPASSPAIKVGPKQDFRGFVNAKNNKSIIRVLCPGPTNTGHPLAHQSVRVAPAIDPFFPSDGFTGTAATSIGAWLTWPTTVKPAPPAYIATFSGYKAVPIPTTITVPCGGSGQMLFLPAPGSRTVKAATVSLTFMNMGL